MAGYSPLRFKRAEMPDLIQIAKAIDFVEDNLCEPIAVADMAQAASYSLYYFCRTFNQATHHTPYDYLMRRRLSEAARMLFQSDNKIIDVALDPQFNGPETFARAFKRMFALQPSQWRKLGPAAGRWTMPRLTLAHLQHLQKGDYLKAVLKDRPAFQLAGLMARGGDDPAAVGELWALLYRELVGVAPLATRGGYRGLFFLGKGWDRAGSLYLAAVEAHDLDTAGTPLVVKALPARTWARFIHKGARQDLPLTLDYVFHTWLPKSGRALGASCVLERYGSHPSDIEDAESETEIWIPLA